MDEFEEYLVMNSGVVIKAGSSFKLPVFCEKKGWRVVWKFTVKEESADVGFALVDQRGNKTVVAPDRVNELSGVYNVDADATTLLFEWDNSFSWLTEKTLDYHVSVQEPLTPAKQVVKAQERSIHHSSQQLRDGIAILSTEVMRRTELKHAAERLRQSEQEKETYLQQFQDRKEDIVKQKSDLQAKMEVLKNALSEMFTEQDEIEEDAKALEKAWNGAIAEQEDAETTIRLAETSQLELLAQELEEQVQRLEQELFSVRDQMSTA
uniref:GOLD domain-containing protein n=1 Tax=Globisporangium ultimum (strain ATCC 200006 / CBS 805.95 / DAOM BR144) TaxID=431595 RepID=K3WDK9_GLOUD